MTGLEAVTDLQKMGRFRDALRTLEEGRLVLDHRIEGKILKAGLLIQLGRIGEATRLATDLLNSNLSTGQRSSCEYVLGKACRENRDNVAAIEHLNRSASLAKQARDHASLCRAQLSLMLVVCESCGPDAASPLIAE